MSARKIDIAPELITEGKRLYEETSTPLREVAALMGISRTTLENRIRAWNWQSRPTASRPIGPLHAVRGAALSPGDGGEAERVSRTLASLARTLREVAALNQPDAATLPDETDDDPIPSNIDEFRNELARRINALIDEAERNQDHGTGGTGAGAGGGSVNASSAISSPSRMRTSGRRSLPTMAPIGPPG